jgi:hypothetical protein
VHRLSRLLVLAVLSVFALAAGACGGDGISSKPAADVLKETFGPDKPVKSGKVDVRVVLDAQGLQNVDGPLKLSLKGPFSSSGENKLPRFDFDVVLDVAGQRLTAGGISTGDKGWLKFAGTNLALGDAAFQRFRASYERDQRKAATSDNPTFRALGVDPARWLASPEKAADATVGGAETVHVTSAVDVPAFLEDVNKLLGRADATGAAAAAGASGRVPRKLTDAQRKQIETSIKSARLDVYAGKDDGTLRRLNLQVAFDVPADVRPAAGGLSTGRLGFDLVFSELNEKQEIAAPRTSRPLSDLTRGGATGATGPAAAPAAPGPGAEPEATPEATPDAYRACLDAAGAELAEVQKCAPLLNGR